ncbi:MAG: ABC transporter ATP-binding protein [Clostridiaceae bacterium]|nr:ABC transporter ATP-binding protein [Clostridiaceae bacterium]
MGKGEKPQDVGKVLRRLFSYLAGFRLNLILAAILILISSLAGIIGTWFLKPLINGLTSGASLQQLAAGLFQMGAIYLAGTLSAYLSSLMMVTVAQQSTLRIRNDMFDHVQDLPLRFFDSKTHGELMSRFTNDVDTVYMALEQSLSQMVTSAISVAGTFIMMLVLSPFLTIFAVAMLVIMLQIIKLVGKRSSRYFRSQQQALGDLNGLIEEMMIGQKVVKVFNYEDQSIDHFRQRNETLRQASTQAQTFAGILMPIMGNLSYVHYALTAMVGAIMVIQGRLDIGSIAAFLQYTRSFSMPITQLANLFNGLLSALAGAERIFNLIDQPAELDDGTVTLTRVVADSNGTLREVASDRQNQSARPGEPVQAASEAAAAAGLPIWAWKVPAASEGEQTRLVPVLGDVRFRDVTFGYIPEKTVLKGISLFAKPGQKIAFVGSTGAGKTTITNLINRFYEIGAGEITYDGIPIDQIRKTDLRRTLGMVLQDVHLFQGTIRENIRYGKLDASDEDIVQAARVANADTFISRLPQGYDTVLQPDGTNLSQGQRQLISIARAAVADPPVLILDEATSSIDTRTEKLIEKGMDQLMNGRTTLVIAHRLSTVRNARAIMVLEQGSIIERGDHRTLLDLHGRYYQLYTGQSELS